jgi:ComF family protein
MSSVLAQLREGITHLFFPRLCEGCASALLTTEQVLCLSCAQQLPETGYHHIADNDTALRFAGRVPYSYATSFAWFTADGLLQHLLHRLKYRGRGEIGTYLGHTFATSLSPVPWIHEVDLIIPVPLHPAKKAARGYNQAALIAGGLGERLRIATSDKLLLRIRETESQTQKSRTERVNNMAGAFRISNAGALAGKHILLCDDVLTTGATLEACAHALQAAPGIKISLATIGIAVS